MSNLRSVRHSVFAVAMATALGSMTSPVAWSQSQSINGTIRGLVTDSTGASITGASVTIKNIDTGYTRTVTSGTDGLYVVPDLPVGNYTVSASSTNFAPLTKSGIRLAAGAEIVIDEHLKAGSVATQVEVDTQTPILEPGRLTVGRTISPEETQNVPLTSRNPYNLVLFQPAVSGHPNPENGIPRTVNTNGLVDRINYQLDGMVDTETDRYGLRLFAISDSYASEIQTIANGAPAEFGNTAGVTFNVITPSGTNQYHGLAQYIWRPKAASACPILQNCALANTPKPSLHVDDFVGSVGGPVLHDKLFFFVAYEHLKRANPQAITITQPNQALLIANGVSASDFGSAASVQRAQWLDLRGDWAITPKHQFFVRYNYFRNNYPFNTNIGGLYAISSASDFQDRAHIIGAQLISTFSPNLFNEFRGSWPYRNEHHVADPLTGPGPMITISGIANFGGSNGVADKYQEKIPSFNDNVTWIKGTHTFKYGVGFQKNLDTQLADVYTQYTFGSIQDWIDAKAGGTPTNPYATIGYSNVKASIGQPGAAYHSIFFDFFAQDTWQFRKTILVSYGVRYDQYRAPTPPAGEPFLYTQNFRTPLGDFAPRLGISWQVFPKTVVRVNSGMYYEATPTNTWYTPLYNNGAAGSGSFIASESGYNTHQTAPVTPPTAQQLQCLPKFPQSPNQVPAACLGTQSITALTPNFKNEYTWNASLQVQQQLSNSDSLTVGYLLTNGRNMQFLRNMNLINPNVPPLVPLADGRPVYSSAINANTRLFPQYNNITLIDVGSNSSYNALTVSYLHRIAWGIEFNAAYTWSHSISNTPEANSYEFSASVEDPSNPLRDRSRSGVDHPNAGAFSLVYDPKFHLGNKLANGFATGNNFALLGNLMSGDTQNETVSASLNGDSTATSRPLFVGRNSLRAPAVYQYDARYTRSFGKYWDRVSPQIFVEANNLFNRTNVTSINTTATVVTSTGGSSPVGTVTTGPTKAPVSSVLEARILQFGAKIQF